MNQFKEEVLSTLKQYPSLTLMKNGEVKGTLDITNKSGVILESFSLKIKFPYDYPKKLPIVSETSDILPRNKDAHVYSNGQFCLTSPLKEYLICKNGITLSVFMSEILIPFLSAQLAILCGYIKEFPQGEYGHGSDGIYESYVEYFEVNDPAIIISALQMVKNKNIRNMACFCNSGKKLKTCHLNQIMLLKSYDKASLNSDIASLTAFKNKIQII